jgi:hypothetical protein
MLPLLVTPEFAATVLSTLGRHVQMSRVNGV